MLFDTFEFLIFFLLVASLYFILPYRFRWIWLLLASYYFYMAWEPTLIILLLVSSSIDYLCGLKIYAANQRKIRKTYLYLSLTVNLGLLFFFKYFGFFSTSSLQILNFFGIGPEAKEIDQTFYISQTLLPIGISFYTFQTLSYTFDIYRGRITPEKNFGIYALYVSFFPQLVAGPIERSVNLLPQLRKKIPIEIQTIKKGMIMMAWGFFLKVVVADRLGIYVDQVYSEPQNYSGLPLILSGYFFTFQIYYDFAAYTSIALGAAKIMGIDLMENFNRPIFAKNLGDFWQKWHISLMSWLRDYLFKPLVFNFKTNGYIALLIVFALTGLWHGANWTFVIWGLINGIFLLLEIWLRRFRRDNPWLAKFSIHPRIDQLLKWLLIFHLIVFSLIFFRSLSLQHAMIYISNILNFSGFELNIYNDQIELMLSFLLIIFVQIINYFKREAKIHELVRNRKIFTRWSIYLLFILVIVFLGIDRQAPFIYFQF